jgi:hypothetical protein
MFGPDSWLLVPISAFLVIGWIVATIVDGMQRRARMKTFTEFYSRLLDRMPSPRDFSEFLQTRGGQRFLDSLQVERGHPIERVLRALQIGLVALTVGLGCIGADTQVFWGDRGGLRVVGIIIMALGVGFLLSATASFGITKSLGLLKRDLEDTREYLTGGSNNAPLA